MQCTVPRHQSTSNRRSLPQTPLGLEQMVGSKKTCDSGNICVPVLGAVLVQKRKLNETRLLELASSFRLPLACYRLPSLNGNTSTEATPRTEQKSSNVIHCYSTVRACQLGLLVWQASSHGSTTYHGEAHILLSVLEREGRVEFTVQDGSPLYQQRTDTKKRGKLVAGNCHFGARTWEVIEPIRKRRKSERTYTRERKTRQDGHVKTQGHIR